MTEGNTGTKTVALTVTLSAPISSTVSVAYATVNGTATAGVDYQSTSGTLTFTPGATSRTFNVTIIGDRVKDSNETVQVLLSNASGATIGAGSATVTIVDDESALTAAQPVGAEALAQADAQAADSAVPTRAPSEADLQALMREALRRMQLDAAQRALLGSVRVRVTDLPGLELGEYRDGVVLIYDDAAGHGWFVDTTPGDDAEFSPSGDVLLAAGDVAARMDLLSVIAHELGHAAGLDHADDGPMAVLLEPGVRTVEAPVAMPLTAGRLDAPAFATRAAPDDARPRPVINLSTGLSRSGPVAAAPAVKWLGDFVNHLGKTEAQLNPNAALRLQLDVTPKVAPRLSALLDRGLGTSIFGQGPRAGDQAIADLASEGGSPALPG